MKYATQSLRRTERGIPETSARELLTRGIYGVLSMSGPGNAPYGIPLHFVWDGDDKLYFHAAQQGKS